MPRDGIAVACRDLVKVYETETAQVRAVQGIDAEFPRAALTAVVGPSGSGKSSLLRVLAAMDRPTAGAVEIEGASVDFATARLRHLRREAVGYAFQRPSDNFVSYMTVGEHLRLAQRSGGRDAQLDPRELLSVLGIEHRIDHRPGELSGGEQQRAAFAQILMAGPRIIVADEPTAELDSESAHHVLEVVRRLIDKGIAFVFATHDPGVTEMADKVIELDHGRLKAPDDPRPRLHPSAMERAKAAARLPRPSTLRWTERMASGPRVAAAARPSSPSVDVLLDARSLSKTFHRGDEEVHALQDVSFSLGRGRIAGLVGRSGSGKTTLLNVIAGWEQPDSGEIERRPREGVGDLPRWDQIAVVPQKLGLIEELTVRKNVAYPLLVVGHLEERERRVDDLLVELGLDELADRLPRQISVGEQQRTAMARALVVSPRLLLADEPTGHQDARSVERVLEVLRAAAQEGTACLIATHNEELVPSFDVTFHMADGRLDTGAAVDTSDIRQTDV